VVDSNCLLLNSYYTYVRYIPRGGRLFILALLFIGVRRRGLGTLRGSCLKSLEAPQNVAL
jgi:hypothetical protein